ncbi:jg14700 [Pararge aegeria aegeria]|uniref:Jg14700 protein n=1 Tax=Pararge aegeria aegeria TaxID=348720 RepID=A0A8S4SIX1_9NEOP|nr:jg14700 [Pararge aegeria aegeria]
MWPCFGSKTDDANNRQSGWKLKAHPNKNLDCVFWTRQLIGTSQDRRKSGMLSELFITARGDPKPASRTLISGWIKSVLKDAGVDATPGSVRSAVASLNWLEKFPIDQILQTGNWRQEHTFRTYYQRELANQSRNNDFTTSVSLSNFFEPVR